MDTEEFKAWEKQRQEAYRLEVKERRRYLTTPEGQEEAKRLGYNLDWITDDTKNDPKTEDPD
jgi:hypothetical protein